MNNTFKKSLLETNRTALILSTLPLAKRRAILGTLASCIEKKKITIMAANKKDINLAEKNQNKAFIDRLTLTEKSFLLMVKQVKGIARSEEVLGKIIEKRKSPIGFSLQKITMPLGVIAVIYESRPNVTIDVTALCLMSGNACVLKGGSDALNTNRVLVGCVHTALAKYGLPKAAVCFLNTRDRSVVDKLVKESELVDVLIPRGGYELVRKVVRESRIPILYHASGGARIYIDQYANLDMALRICLNAKTNRPATCNAADTILVHEKIAARFIPVLVKALQEKGVDVRGDVKTKKLSSARLATRADYATEFLDLIVVIKTVKNVDEAVAFIREYGKKHSEGVVSENKDVVSKFVQAVDAAGIFVNCSTRLHDGGVFGFGAEMGIATGKLHARGPVGLKELTTYKWVAYGRGEIRE